MFTGIIETTEIIQDVVKEGGLLRMSIQRPNSWELTVGQSIAVNGACLTVVSFDDKIFTVELMEETLKKTTLRGQTPHIVNLERAMLPTDRFEGHIVQGHVDTVGDVVAVAVGDGHHVTISFDATFAHLVVPKGSITIDGVSLTVVDCTESTLTVALIPHTLKHTTLSDLEEGSQVNLEFDIIGKYITRV